MWHSWSGTYSYTQVHLECNKSIHVCINNRNSFVTGNIFHNRRSYIWLQHKMNRHSFSLCNQQCKFMRAVRTTVKICQWRFFRWLFTAQSTVHSKHRLIEINRMNWHNSKQNSQSVSFLPMLIQEMCNKVVLILQHLATEVATSQIILVMHVAVDVVHGCILENQSAKITAVNIRSWHQVVEKLFRCEIDQGDAMVGASMWCHCADLPWVAGTSWREACGQQRLAGWHGTCATASSVV